MKYIIKKGKHWPQWWWLRWFKIWNWPLFYGDTISYKVRFHKGCDQPYMKQWNKLFGFSIGLNPNKHSARFGFDFFQDDFTDGIILTHYKHEFYKHNGADKRPEAEKQYGVFGSDYTLKIRKQELYNGKTLLWYYFNNKVLKCEQTEIPYSKWGWKLYPYVGGKSPAQQDCTISLTQTKINT